MNHLFQKGKIGNLELKNRIIMSAIGINSLVDVDGGVSERIIDYYLERACGGVGMIISGAARVEDKLEPSPEAPFSPYFRLNNRRHSPRLNTLVELLHDHDTKFFVQLTAGVGRIGSINPVAPSSVPAFKPPYRLRPKDAGGSKKPVVMTREITLDEIKRLIRDFAIAAKLAHDAGADGIELHGHEGYLLDQFMTELWNKRTDEYGGSTRNRSRLACDIIHAIKEKTRYDFPVIYQYGAAHKISGGRELEESIEIAGILEEAGADALRIDSGCYENWYFPHPPIYQPEGLNVDLAAKIKENVDVPVITMGKMGNPSVAEFAIKENKVDFVALGRPLLADPEWPNKVREGRIDEIRPCIGDHEGCLGRGYFRQYLSCTVNPRTGAERFLGIHVSRNLKKIFVLGGGPSGMEAARVATMRGHTVELFEKKEVLGGLLNPGSVPYFKKELSVLKDYYINQMKILGVRLHTGYDVQEYYSDIISKSPDCIVVAVGATPNELPYDKTKCDKQALTSIDVLNGEETGNNVVVLGGGLVGCEIALHLRHLNKQAKILELESEILRNVNFVNRSNILVMLAEKDVDVLTNRKIINIGADLEVEAQNGTYKMEYDTLVFAIGLTPRRHIYDRLECEVPDILRIGDCNKPGRLLNAIWDGYRKARLV